MVGGSADLFERQCLRPDTSLEHVTVVGSTERKVCTAFLCLQSLFGGTQEIIRHFYCTHIEPCSTGLLRYTNDTREGHDGLQYFRGLTEDVLSVGLDKTQTIVFGEYQLLGHLSVSGLKEDHVAGAVLRFGRFDHHVDREVGLRQIAFGFGGRGCVAVEMQRCRSRQTGRIGDTGDLEVIVLVQVVSCYRFVEA